MANEVVSGKPIPIIRGSLGLHTRLDPVRIPGDADSAVFYLAEAVDVWIDSSGRINRRKGTTATARTESSHSLFCDGGDCLFVSANALYRLNSDYTRTGIRSGITGWLRMWYAQVNDEIYYSNGKENGVYRNGASYTWVALPYVGPDTVKTFSSPPVGRHLQLYNGRLYMSQDNVIWYTEPFAYSWVDAARNYIEMPGKEIRMIRAVVDGLYVSTNTTQYFLQGPDPAEFSIKVVAQYPAVEGTDTLINGGWVGDGVAFKVAVWTSLTGICIGLPGGEFKNVTDRKIILPPTVTGAAGVIENKYISTLEP
jgi:hypothetical protein